MNPTNPAGDWQPSRRDGHLSDLDLELVAAHPGEYPVLQAHIAECEECQARLQAVMDDNAWQSLPPPVLHSVIAEAPSTPTPANRSWWPVLAILAAAAVALFVAIPSVQPPVPDDFRAKGASIDLEVFVHDGEAVTPVRTDDVVHPGDRLGFRVTPRRDGYLYVVGFDATGPYPCWPQDGGDAQFFRTTGISIDLDAAIRLDDRLGRERIVAVLCEEPVSFEAAAQAVASGGATGGCVSDEVGIDKQETP